jgi:molybdenum cofactor cytidylyltransferase
MGERNKLLLPFRGSCFLAHIADQILASEPDELLVVVGHEQERVREALADRTIQLVENPDYAEGMTTSIRAGIQAASSDAWGFMICLSDLPFIETAEYQELIDQFKTLLPANPQLVLRPVVGDQPGNPVLFSASYREELISHTKMEGCRGLIRQYKERVHRHSMKTDHVLRDIDTPEEYERYFVDQSV